MPHVNSVGDLVLTDPEAMRALAEPVRLALLDRLRRMGPSTAAEFSSDLQTSRSSMEEHLRELETYRFVSRDAAAGDANESRWHAVAKGFVFEIPDDPAGEAAARGLSNVMYLSHVDLPRRWVADDEPRLPLEWGSGSRPLQRQGDRDPR